MYRKLSPSVIKLLYAIFGQESVVSSEEELGPYCRDETPGLHFSPEAAVMPENIKQIGELLKVASQQKFPVTMRGGGTGLSGGALAVKGGVVVSTERLNRITDIDTENRMAVVEPGVINGVLQQQAEKLGLFYPVNPASMDSCTMGGNAAESTGGANTVRYGTTRNYLTGIEALAADGSLLSAGGKVVKNSTDQNLMQLLCGSEGTLAVFTKLTFRLIDRPRHTSWLIAPYRDLYAIHGGAMEILGSGIAPTMVELMDSDTLQICSSYLDMEIQHSGLHQLLIRLDDDEGSQLEKRIFRAGELCVDSGAEDVLVAATRREQDRIWKIRASLHDAITSKGRSVCEEDIVVPVAAVNLLLKDLHDISAKHGFGIFVFGHLGDGNMHVNFTGDSKDNSKTEALRNSVFESAVKLGGKLSGEHGIGISKKDYFTRYVDPGYIRMLRNIKKSLDPGCILNPGKISDQ